MFWGFDLGEVIVSNDTNQYVYVLYNESNKFYYKIGWTSRKPQDRANEINRNTGVVGIWEVGHQWKVEDGYWLEQRIFREFSQHRQERKEIFHFPNHAVEQVADKISQFGYAGGILIAIAFLLDSVGIDIKSLTKAERGSFGSITEQAALFMTIGKAAFSFMLPILAGFIAMSIADRPGLAVGFVGGAMAAAGKSGFLGALLAGFIAVETHPIGLITADEISMLLISDCSSFSKISLARFITSLGSPARFATSIPKLLFVPPRFIFRRNIISSPYSFTMTE